MPDSVPGAVNLDLLIPVARRLARSRERFVFLGGAVVDLLITDRAAPPARPTDDVDVIVEIASYAANARLSSELRRLGFVEDVESSVICRWKLDGVQVDVMPTDKRILGFSNRWYSASIENAAEAVVGGISIKVISAPYFLATKLEAFRGRGDHDYVGSHDLEDILNVVNGRPELQAEVRSSAPSLVAYLRKQIGGLLASVAFLNALPGHCEPGREKVVLERLRTLAAAGR